MPSTRTRPRLSPSKARPTTWWRKGGGALLSHGASQSSGCEIQVVRPSPGGERDSEVLLRPRVVLEALVDTTWCDPWLG